MPDETPPADANGPGSVSTLFDPVRRRDPDAVAALWERYVHPLARVAANRLHPSCQRTTAPDDIATDVILEFCGLLAGPDADRRFPRLHSRRNLWGLLVRMAVCAAFDHNTKERRRAGIVAGESALGVLGLAAHPNREPPPEFAAAVNALFAQLDDPDHPEQGERLRTVARLVAEGYTQTEIARHLACSEKTVGIKVKLIRKIWREREPADGES